MNRVYLFSEIPDLIGEDLELCFDSCIGRGPLSDDHYEFCFSSGRASLVIDGRTYTVSPDTVILIPRA